MKMIRTIVKPIGHQMVIELPDSYIGKNVDILAFILDAEEASETLIQRKSFNSLLSEEVLSKEWLSKAEDEAWQNL